SGLARYEPGRLGRALSAASRTLLVSSPAVSSDLRRLYPAIADTEGEGDDIFELFRSVQRLSGVSARQSALAREASGGEIVHFPGPGSTGEGNGALLLAPEEPDRSFSGLMTAEKIAALDWRSCQLAVLSACSTALSRAGPAARGGLVDAFLTAGARQVV